MTSKELAHQMLYEPNTFESAIKDIDDFAKQRAIDFYGYAIRNYHKSVSLEDLYIKFTEEPKCGACQ